MTRGFALIGSILLVQVLLGRSATRDLVPDGVNASIEVHLSYLERRGAFKNRWSTQQEFSRDKVRLGTAYRVVFLDHDVIGRVADGESFLETPPLDYDQYVLPFSHGDVYLGTLTVGFSNYQWSTARSTLAAVDSFSWWVDNVWQQQNPDQVLVLAKTFGIGTYAFTYRGDEVQQVFPVDSFAESAFGLNSMRSSKYSPLDYEEAISALHNLARRFDRRVNERLYIADEVSPRDLDVWTYLTSPEPRHAAEALRDRARDVGWESYWAWSIALSSKEPPPPNVAVPLARLASRLVGLDELEAYSAGDAAATADVDTTVYLVLPEYLWGVTFYTALLEEGAVFLEQANNGFYFLAIANEDIDRIAGRDEVQWIGPYSTGYKFDGPRRKSDPHLVVTPFAGYENRVMLELRQLGFKDVRTQRHLRRITCVDTEGRLQQAAELTFVKSIRWHDRSPVARDHPDIPPVAPESQSPLPPDTTTSGGEVPGQVPIGVDRIPSEDQL